MVTRYRPRKPINLLPMSIGDRLSASTESFAQHLHELYEHSRRQIAISNDNYKSIADSHKKLQEFATGDEVMVRMRPERFSPGTLKKLHARRMGVLRSFGSNAYELDISRDRGINPVFNIEDLTLHHTPVAYPTTIPDDPASTFMSSQSFLI